MSKFCGPHLGLLRVKQPSSNMFLFFVGMCLCLFWFLFPPRFSGQRVNVFFVITLLSVFAFGSVQNILEQFFMHKPCNMKKQQQLEFSHRSRIAHACVDKSSFLVRRKPY